MVFNFKSLFNNEEVTFPHKYLILHPFLKKSISQSEDSNDLANCVEWDDIIKLYFKNNSIEDLYVAFQVYYYGSYYFNGSFIYDNEYFEKIILPMVDKLKNITNLILPEGEKLPQDIIKLILKRISYDEFSVEGYISSAKLTGDEVKELYNKKMSWKIRTMDDNVRIISELDAIATKIIWKQNKQLSSLILELGNYCDIIEII